jgi:hypothetical protein
MEEVLRTLWADDNLRTSDIAKQLGVSMSSLYRIVNTLKLPKRWSNRRQHGEIDPTPEEITKMAEEIRAGWSVRERRRRTQSSRWSPPEYCIDAKGLRISH